MDLKLQARIKETVAGKRRKDFVVILGSVEPASAKLVAETVTAGDPTCTGPLAGVPLGLPVYHILEREIKEQIPLQVWEEHMATLELLLEAEELAAAVQAVRKVYSKL